MRLTHYFSIFAIACIFASCSKGDTGATGPQGPAGNNGVSDLSAVTYSVTVGDWTATTTANTTWISTWSEPNITDYNNDAVEVYWSNTGSGWLSLPATGIIISGDELSYGFTDNSVTFTYYTGGSAVEPPSYYAAGTTLYFNVVVIPPSIQVKYPGTNWKNAAEAAKLPEVQTMLNGHK
jgi:hypothetical protein